MTQNVSDEELDNARHEMEFCFNQIKDLEPQALQLSKGRLEAETVVQQLLNKVLTDQWNEQFKELMLKTIGAQVKYIKLLERRIGK
jgi:hypothetical protein